MIVTANHVREVEVELDDYTIRKIILDKFCKIFDMPEEAYIENGKLMIDVEYYTSHPWQDKEVQRVATEEDKIALKILRKLRQEL